MAKSDQTWSDVTKFSSHAQSCFSHASVAPSHTQSFQRFLRGSLGLPLAGSQRLSHTVVSRGYNIVQQAQVVNIFYCIFSGLRNKQIFKGKPSSARQLFFVIIMPPIHAALTYVPLHVCSSDLLAFALANLSCFQLLWGGRFQVTPITFSANK